MTTPVSLAADAYAHSAAWTRYYDKLTNGGRDGVVPDGAEQREVEILRQIDPDLAAQRANELRLKTDGVRFPWKRLAEMRSFLDRLKCVAFVPSEATFSVLADLPGGAELLTLFKLAGIEPLKTPSQGEVP